MKRRNSLTKKKDFEQLFKYGRGHRKDFLYLKVKDNNLGFFRFGIIVSKKISKSAVKRNKIKRRLREALNNNIINKGISKGADVAIVALPDITDKKFKEIDKCIKEIFSRAGII